MRKSSRVDEIAALTAQFVLTLRATVVRVKQRLPPGPAAESPALQRVEELLETGTWEACYEAEQQLVSLFDADTLDERDADDPAERTGGECDPLLCAP